MTLSSICRNLNNAAVLLAYASWQEGHARAMSLPRQNARWGTVAANAALAIEHLTRALTTTGELHSHAYLNARNFWDHAVALRNDLEAEGSFVPGNEPCP